MALMKLAVLAVVCATALANGPGRKGGKGADHGWHRGNGTDHGRHHGLKCGPPPTEMTANLDAATQQQIAAIWATTSTPTTEPANCSAQLAQQATILEQAFITKIKAQAQNLTEAAQTVFNNQILPVLNNATAKGMEKFESIKTIVDAQTDATVQTALKALFTFQGKHKGKGRKSSEETVAP